MQTQFNLENGKNRALVFYIVPNSPNYSAPTDVEEIVESVFTNAGIESDEASAATLYRFVETKNALNIALCYGDAAKRLKVGGTFDDVCVGVYFYDQPIPPEPEVVEPDDPTELEEEEDEPIPPPSITSLICDALRDEFGGVYGASEFVISAETTFFGIEVE